MYTNIHKYSHPQPEEHGYYNIEGYKVLFTEDTWNYIGEIATNDLWLTSLIYLSKDFENNDIDQAFKIYSLWHNKYSTPEPRSNNPTSYAWNEISVTARLLVLGYLYSKKPGKTLENDIRNHLEWLTQEHNYVYKHNHGQYQDIALVKFFKEYGNLIQDNGYVKLAIERFTDSISHCISQNGVHLEHSPSYHFSLIRMLRTFLESKKDNAIEKILLKMSRVSKYYTYHDGTLPQLGDTYRAGGYYYAGQDVFFFDQQAGILIFRKGHWDLFFTCWHHSQTHKHSDELNFELAYKKQKIIVDSGNYGYNYNDALNIYGRSLAAHNSLAFNDRDYTARELKPYGSGLLAAEETENGIVAIGYNPHLLNNGVTHIRIIEIYEDNFFLTDYIKNSGSQNIISEMNLHLDPECSLSKISRLHFQINEKSNLLHLICGHGTYGIGKYFLDKENYKGIYFPFDTKPEGNFHLVLSDRTQNFSIHTSKICSTLNDLRPTIVDNMYYSVEKGREFNLQELAKRVANFDI